ncbi:hypothetical protein PQQ52_01845 [Paraburkholderia sediminicola]|uniref:hypothetical protein n=1 Tax=Paraburkholderia sediminicola TaxID=458836 RepID=UPI0038B6E8E8
MSTTIPLTLIEGAMALPSLSPRHRLLPAPFGRDWALLPPRPSLRAELKALYAAVLRTFCLDEEAIRALCQWESSSKPPAASSGFIPPATSPTTFDAPVDEPLQASAETARFSPVSIPAAPASPRGGSMHWGALAGGACALGGAALLAWIALGHLAQRHTITDVKPAGKIPLRQEAQLADRLSPDAAVHPHATANSLAAGVAPSAASSSVHVAGASGFARKSVPASSEISPNALAAVPLHDFTASAATEIAAPVKATSALTTAGKNVSRRRDKQRKDAASLHKKSGRRSQTVIATRLPHMSPMNHEAQQTSPKPSSAGSYSPRASLQLGTDEYASTTMSAGTHLRNIAQPSRPASSLNLPGSGGTEWIDHMSQRRVTDVPNQFAK